MVNGFYVIMNANTTDNNALLAMMDWFASNYGSQIVAAFARGHSNRFEAKMLFATYNEAKSALIAIKTQYSTELDEYILSSEEVIP